MTRGQNQPQLTTFGQLPGWAAANHQLSLEAFQRSASEIIDIGRGFSRVAQFGGNRDNWLETCEAALSATDPTSFFEAWFRPYRVFDSARPEGLFTGYYEPEASGSRIKSARFHVPLYRRPPELIALKPNGPDELKYGELHNGSPHEFFSRSEIETGALEGRGLEICWLESQVDAFFIHIQGSGRIKLDEGGTLRLAFAAKNGLPYTSIGAALLAKGIGTSETMSMQFLRNWMSENPIPAQQLMWENKSYIFFREIDVLDPNLGALGAAQVNLTPLRSLAVDRSYWMFGTPLWLNTKTPPESSIGETPFQHLMIAQDTGTAIRGLQRGDVYWGWEPDAVINAGHMKSHGEMFALLPNKVAASLGL